MAALNRKALWALLGYPESGAAQMDYRVDQVSEREGITLQELTLSLGGLAIPALLLQPANPKPPLPAVLYCHAHGNRYDIGKDEVLYGRPALMDPPLGMALAKAGYIVLCPDMPAFGARADAGSEGALAKARHWHGRTLIGQMLAELSAAFKLLSVMPQADPARIAAFGFSMGATLTYWLASLEPRVAGVAHFCAFANMRPLIESGAHDLHAPYMTVPGLLEVADMADIASLIAPRPQLVGAGAQDPLTPPEALHPALKQLQSAYAKAGRPEALTCIVSPATGHIETPDMRHALFAFLEKL